jgi:hypothetical protein
VPVAFRISTFEVHLVWHWSKHAIEMTWVQLDLVVEPLLVTHLNSPALVEARDQMSALDMVDAVLLPAVVKFLSVDGSLFAFDLACSFEKATNEFLVNNSLWWVSHLNLIN